MKDLSILEDKIGIHFKTNKNILRTALIHSSYANEHGGCEHNERLEFLGDAVLGLVTAEYCYKNFQGDEGELTDKRKSVVKNIRLAQVADEIGLDEYLFVGKGEIENNKEKARKKRIGNALEALIGAIFLNKGYEIAKQFIIANFSQYFNSTSNELL